MARLGRIRRLVLLTAIVAAAIGGVALRAQTPLGPPVTPSEPSNQQGRQITLRDQLRVGLKAVTRGDFAFIDLVILKVDDGTLPRKMVDSTFLWARRRVQTQSPQYRNRPMVFFQPALVLRARAIGVRL
jgi:hypothetical protein